MSVDAGAPPRPQPASKGHRATWRGVPAVAAPLAVVGVAALLRVWGLTRQGLWYDEAITGWLVRESPGRMLAAIPRTESTPPLFYVLTWGFVRVLGHGALGLRALSVVAGVGAVVATFGAARLLVGVRAALVAALLVAVNPLLVWYSQEARSYSLLVLGSAVTLWLAVRADARPSWGRLLAWSAAAAATLWTHYFAVFFIGAQAAGLLLRTRGRARARAAAAVTLMAVAAAPLVPLAFEQRGHAHLFRKVALHVRVRQIGEILFGGFAPPAPRVVLWVIAVVMVAAIVAAVTMRRGAHRAGARAAATVGAAAIGVPIALAAGGADFLDARNVIGGVVPLTIAAAAGFVLVAPWLAGRAAVAGIAATSVALLVALAHDPWAQRPQWQDVAAALRGNSPRVILLPRGRPWLVPIGYELPRTYWLPHNGARVREVQIVRRVHQRSCARATFWGPSCHLLAPHVRWHAPAGFRPVGQNRVAGFSITTYRSPSPVLIRPAGGHRHRLALTPMPVPPYPWKRSHTPSAPRPVSTLVLGASTTKAPGSRGLPR